ncbi:MAG: peptidoglycan DD-metalloendopeptidase family protein [Marmoricola sp.]
MACALVAVQGAEASDPLAHKHKQLQHQMKVAESSLEDASAGMRSAQLALNRAQRQLDVANAKLAKTRAALAVAVQQDDLMRAKLAQAQNQLSAAQAAVVQGRVTVARQRDQIGSFAAETFQNGDPQLMQIITVMQSGSAGEISGRLGVIDSVALKQSSLLAQYRQQLADLNKKEQEVAAATALVAQQQQATAAAVVTRQHLETAAQQQQQTVARLVTVRKAAKARAARIMRRDQARLNAILRKDAAIKRAILERKRHDRNRSWHGSGMLLRPVDGPITSPFGWRIHPIYHYWGLHDGDDFAASCGQPQFAADNGVVMSEYYSSVWGNRLYIDLGNINGHNYTVIHNHLRGYAVHVGQHVRRGQVVGYTGTTGWSTGCHLHFTVLRDGVAVNPAQYF